MQIITRSEAMSQGLPRYFTGKPCSRGHISERYIYAKCVQCAAEHSREMAKANPEMVKRFKDKYKANNEEKVRLAKRANYERNKERYAAANKEFAQRNREKMLEYYRKSREKHKEKRLECIANYRKVNAGKVNAWTAKRRAMKKKATPAWADLNAIESMYVKAKALGLHVDHIIPLCGETVCGLHVETNLQLLTPSENSKKNNRFEQIDELHLIRGEVVKGGLVKVVITEKEM